MQKLQYNLLFCTHTLFKITMFISNVIYENMIFLYLFIYRVLMLWRHQCQSVYLHPYRLPDHSAQQLQLFQVTHWWRRELHLLPCGQGHIEVRGLWSDGGWCNMSLISKYPMYVSVPSILHLHLTEIIHQSHITQHQYTTYLKMTYSSPTIVMCNQTISLSGCNLVFCR